MLSYCIRRKELKLILGLLAGAVALVAVYAIAIFTQQGQNEIYLSKLLLAVCAVALIGAFVAAWKKRTLVFGFCCGVVIPIALLFLLSQICGGWFNSSP